LEERYEWRQSADGSYTLYSKEYEECYHSVKDGALREALKKHVEPAFELTQKSHLRILDICFGLGFNTLATLYYFAKQKKVRSLEIFSPELDIQLLKTLPNFPYPDLLKPFVPVVQELVERGRYETSDIRIELEVGDAREYIKSLHDIDIVYQDAFSPKKNPVLWTVEYFRDLYAITSEDMVLTTYSIATPVRLALAEAGFLVYEYAREDIKKMTIAAKQALPLKKINMEEKRKRASSLPLRDDNVV